MDRQQHIGHVWGVFKVLIGKNFIEHRGHAESAEKCAALSVLFGVMEVAAEKYADGYVLKVSPGYRRLEWMGDLGKIKDVVEEVIEHVAKHVVQEEARICRRYEV